MTSHRNLLYPNNKIPLKKIINYGNSVRSFFREDLQTVAPQGYCLMPEWICQSMVESVYAANWQPLFYPVISPAQASVVLQADIQAMTKMLNALPQPCAILLAPPLGYTDPGCIAFLLKVQRTPNIHVFLDLSQGYGIKDYRQEVLNVHATYYSFNGNKLISTGGALRICLTDRDKLPPSVRDIFTTFYAAAEKKFTALSGYLKSHAIEDDIHNAALYSSHQSSPYRTVLNWEKCSPSLQKLLKRQGLIQPLLAEPRQEKEQLSSNYHQWCGKIMLMFSSPRVEWSQ